MGAKDLDNLEWFADSRAARDGAPGIVHSYMASTASALNYLDPTTDATWLMGASGFAFRIWISDVFCPSALSMFTWRQVLPEAIEQSGWSVRYVSRMWDEGDREEERRNEAHQAIVDGISAGRPAIAWDLADVEWGLIAGYDDARASYRTLTHRGEASTLPYSRLGRNGIDVLSVAIPLERNSHDREAVVRRSLEMAVAHADQNEWTERPKYQDGLPAFDLWALLMDRWRLILDAGGGSQISPDLPRWAEFYASSYYSARYYAGNYLRLLADEDSRLAGAAEAYSRVAASLKRVWEYFRKRQMPEAGDLPRMSNSIREAKQAESEAVEHIRGWLG